MLNKNGLEYASESNRYHNFDAAAALNGCTPEAALWGFLTKHIISVKDIVDHPEKCTPEQLDEKIGDCINYLILLKGLVCRRHNWGTTSGVPDIEDWPEFKFKGLDPASKNDSTDSIFIALASLFKKDDHGVDVFMKPCDKCGKLPVRFSPNHSLMYPIEGKLYCIDCARQYNFDKGFPNREEKKENEKK